MAGKGETRAWDEVGARAEAGAVVGDNRATAAAAAATAGQSSRQSRTGLGRVGAGQRLRQGSGYDRAGEG